MLSSIYPARTFKIGSHPAPRFGHRAEGAKGIANQMRR
jgi:hypothetical protein